MAFVEVLTMRGDVLAGEREHLAEVGPMLDRLEEIEAEGIADEELRGRVARITTIGRRYREAIEGHPKPPPRRHR
jgi:hypothetical protein